MLKNLRAGFHWIAPLILLNAADLWITLYALSVGCGEANPWVRPVVLETWFVIAKLAYIPVTILLAALVLSVRPYRMLLIAMTIMLAGVVTYNTVVLITGWSPLDAVAQSVWLWTLAGVGCGCLALGVAWAIERR